MILIDNVTTKPTHPMDLGLPTKSYIWHGKKVDFKPIRYIKLNIVFKYATKTVIYKSLGPPHPSIFFRPSHNLNWWQTHYSQSSLEKF